MNEPELCTAVDKGHNMILSTNSKPQNVVKSLILFL